MAVLVACGLALLPLLTLLKHALIGAGDAPLGLGFDGARQVQGTLLPAPGAAALVGLAGLMARRRRD